MVLGYHVIITAYGFWLPNDPRGSWSNFVGSWELLRFGEATKTNDRRSLARKKHDWRLRLEAKRSLQYPAVHFDGTQALAISTAIGTVAARDELQLWACSILPEHVHLVVGRHHMPIERIVNRLKGEVTRQLLAEEIHPLAEFRDRQGRVPKVWGRREWKVYLDSPEAIFRSIRYVEANPEKESKRKQSWPFVTPYEKNI